MTNDAFHLERFSTPLGPMFIVTDDRDCVLAVGWEDNVTRVGRDLRRAHVGETVERRSPSPARRALEAYFEGDLHAISDLPVRMGGTSFQRDVWTALRTIPLGHTMSYGELATRIGRPRAVRAVGLANGANPIAIVVPCHRVIGADATLTGYGGGIDRKGWLLEHEGVQRSFAADGITRSLFAAS
jgi:methylated-DNA-[protein]-cysteine S-methyltransferase